MKIILRQMSRRCFLIFFFLIKALILNILTKKCQKKWFFKTKIDFFDNFWLRHFLFSKISGLTPTLNQGSSTNFYDGPQRAEMAQRHMCDGKINISALCVLLYMYFNLKRGLPKLVCGLDLAHWLLVENLCFKCRYLIR